MQIHAHTCISHKCQGNPYRMYVHVFACMSWAVHMCMYRCCMCMYLCVSVCMWVKYTTCAYSLQMCICTPSGGPKCTLCATHEHFIRLLRLAILSQAPSELIYVSSTLQRILNRLQQSMKTASWHENCLDCRVYVCVCIYMYVYVLHVSECIWSYVYVSPVWAKCCLYTLYIVHICIATLAQWHIQSHMHLLTWVRDLETSKAFCWNLNVLFESDARRWACSTWRVQSFLLSKCQKTHTYTYIYIHAYTCTYTIIHTHTTWYMHYTGT